MVTVSLTPIAGIYCTAFLINLLRYWLRSLIDTTSRTFLELYYMLTPTPITVF